MERARAEAAQGDKGAQAWLATNPEMIAQAHGYRFNYDRGLEAEPRLGEDQASRDGHWDGLNERVRRQAANGDYDRIVGRKAVRQYLAAEDGKAVA